MASTIKVRPASRTTLPTDWMSLRMPLVVSLWTMATWVMAGSWASSWATRAGSGMRS